MPTFAQTPGPPGPPGMPTYGSRQDRQNPMPMSLSTLHHGDNNHRELPPMSRGDLSMQRGDLPPMSNPMSMSRRSPGPSGSYGPPPSSHLRESRPPTSPNQHSINNPIMSPTDPRSLAHQSQQTHSDKRPSPPPTLPQIQEDNRHSRYSPTLRPTYPSSPRMAASEHGNSQHSSYHQSHEIPYHSPPIVDRRDSDMLERKKHTSEQLSSSHDPHSSHLPHIESYREKPEEPPVSSSLDHGSRVSILNNHQPSHQMDQHSHRMHVDGGSVEEKGIPPFQTFRQDEHSRRRSPPIHLPEIKVPDGPSQQRPSSPRENYGSENHSPVSSIPSGENQRKSSTDQHSNRGPSEISREQLPKIPFQEEQQQQQNSHSPSEQTNNISRLIDNQSNSRPSSPRDNELSKPIVLPSIRNNDRGGSSTRQIDEDYDDTTVDLVNESGVSPSASGSIGQKRPYSSPTSKVGENDDNRDDSNKRSKPSPPTSGRDEALSPVSSHSDRDRELTRERRKSDQSSGSGVAQSPRSE